MIFLRYFLGKPLVRGVTADTQPPEAKGGSRGGDWGVASRPGKRFTSVTCYLMDFGESAPVVIEVPVVLNVFWVLDGNLLQNNVLGSLGSLEIILEVRRSDR